VTVPPTPKRTAGQHVVPRLHLRRFVGPSPKNMVWTYDMQAGTVRPSRVEETGTQRNFYSPQRDDGTYFDGLEQWLAAVESDAAAPYERLLAGEIPTGQERMDFCTFLASLHLRSPAMINAVAEGYGKMIQHTVGVVWRNREQFERSLDQIDADIGTPPSGVSRDDLWEFYQNKEGHVVEVDQKRGLSIMSASNRIQEILYRRHWYLLVATQGFFITSDSPVYRGVPEGQGYGPYGDGGFINPAAEITMPLSPTHALLVTGREKRPGPTLIGREGVQFMNRIRAQGAARLLFSHVRDAGVSKLAAEHKDDGPRIAMTGDETKMAKVVVKRKIS
jgi:hypothetical protein